MGIIDKDCYIRNGFSLDIESLPEKARETFLKVYPDFKADRSFQGDEYPLFEVGTVFYAPSKDCKAGVLSSAIPKALILSLSGVPGRRGITVSLVDFDEAGDPDLIDWQHHMVFVSEGTGPIIYDDILAVVALVTDPYKICRIIDKGFGDYEVSFIDARVLTSGLTVQ